MPSAVNGSESVAVNVSELERRTLSKVKRYMFAYFVLGMMFVQMDRSNIGFAQLTMSKELALTATIFGFAAGIFSLAALLMQVPASVFFEKFGARRWLTYAMMGWALTCCAQAFVHNKTELVLLRFLLGLFEAGFLPGLFSLINMWFKGKNHGVAVSFTQIGAAASGIIGGPFAGWILGHALFGLSGWRNLFLFEGGATFVFALIALLIVFDGPKNTRWLKPEEREFMTNYLAEGQAEKLSHGAIEKANIWEAFKDRRILLLTFSIFCTGCSAATAMYFMPMLLKTAGKGLTNQTVGFMAAFTYIVNVIVAFTWGAHADKHNERHWHAVLPLLVIIVGIILYPMATTSAVALLSMVLINAGNAGVFVGFWATCTTVVGRKTVAKSTAIIFSGSLLGQFIAPVVFGWAMDVTGTKTVGLFIWGGTMLLNFIVLNIFFIRYKAQQKATGGDPATAAAS